MTGELIVLFKSPTALREDFKAISGKFDADRAKLWSDYELTKAALAGDDDALTKAAGPDVALAKMEAARLKLEHGSRADGHLTLMAMAKLRDSLWEFNRNYDQHKRIEKRSARFHGGVR